MTVFLFPDNTVLCNFAAVDRLDLLESVLNGRGRWTAAVAYEAQRSARYLPALAGLEEANWLDEPIEITDEADIRQVTSVRRAVFGVSPKSFLIAELVWLRARSSSTWPSRTRTTITAAGSK